MNCDQVFDILTRGPFPTGTPCDAPVESHLCHCAECRRLADALRPALELFQEAIGPDESRDLPGYWCAASAKRAQPVMSFARPKTRVLAATRVSPPAAPSNLWSAVAAWRLAAAVALGVALGTLINSQSAFRKVERWEARQSGVVAASLRDEDSRQRAIWTEREFLAALPAVCTARPAAAERIPQRLHASWGELDLSSLVCCSECHYHRSHIVPATATAAVSQRCQLCHVN